MMTEDYRIIKTPISSTKTRENYKKPIRLLKADTETINRALQADISSIIEIRLIMGLKIPYLLM